jgi:AcrR family transcriptional regulator
MLTNQSVNRILPRMSPRNAVLSEQMRADASARILRAAASVFSQKGFWSSTTEDVARAAGVSKGLVFNYYKTKDDLLEAILREHLSASLRVWTDEPPEGTPEEQLREIFDRTMQHALEHTDAYRLYFSLLYQPGASPALSRAVTDVKQEVERHYTMLAKIFRTAGAKNARARAMLFQASVNGTFSFLLLQPELFHDSKFPLKAMRDQLVRGALL